LPKDFLDLLEFQFNIRNKNFLIIDEAQNIENIGIILKYLVDKFRIEKVKTKIIVL
jgi:predicted AAA+ superfamily ATPase